MSIRSRPIPTEALARVGQHVGHDRPVRRLEGRGEGLGHEQQQEQQPHRCASTASRAITPMMTARARSQRAARPCAASGRRPHRAGPSRTRRARSSRRTRGPRGTRCRCGPAPGTPAPPARCCRPSSLVTWATTSPRNSRLRSTWPYDGAAPPGLRAPVTGRTPAPPPSWPAGSRDGSRRPAFLLRPEGSPGRCATPDELAQVARAGCRSAGRGPAASALRTRLAVRQACARVARLLGVEQPGVRRRPQRLERAGRPQPGDRRAVPQLEQLDRPLDVGQPAGPELGVPVRVGAARQPLGLDPRLEPADLAHGRLVQAARRGSAAGRPAP